MRYQLNSAFLGSCAKKKSTAAPLVPFILHAVKWKVFLCQDKLFFLVVVSISKMSLLYLFKGSRKSIFAFVKSCWQRPETFQFPIAAAASPPSLFISIEGPAAIASTWKKTIKPPGSFRKFSRAYLTTEQNYRLRQIADQEEPINQPRPEFSRELL